jgi:serine/threonine protein kinase
MEENNNSSQTKTNNFKNFSKYEFLEIVGEGSYGIVYKCLDRLNNQIVAIKRFKETEEAYVRKLISRELRILQMTKHENIVEYKEAFKRKGELYVVFEYVERNLLQVLESEVRLTDDIIREIIFELSLAICYLHSEGIIHRDIKPENLLITNNFNLKLCDFGLARKMHNLRFNKEILTDYVATRWYRAPEVILTKGEYGPEVDFWSIGIIMAEIITGQPLFPGIDDLDQLMVIQNSLGPLNREYIESFQQISPFINIETLMASIVHSNEDKNQIQSLEKKFSNKICNEGIKLMRSLLEVDPKKRIKGEDLLFHPFFEPIRNKKFFSTNNIGFNNLSKTISLKNSQADYGIIKVDDEIILGQCESQECGNNFLENTENTLYKSYYKTLNLDKMKKLFNKESKSVSNIHSGGNSIFSYSQRAIKGKNSQKFKTLNNNFNQTQSIQNKQNSITTFPNNKNLFKYTAKLGLSSSSNQIFKPSKELQSQYKSLLNIRMSKEVLKEHQKKFVASIDKTNITIGKVDKFFTSSIFKNGSTNFNSFNKTQSSIKMSRSDLFKNKTYVENDNSQKINSNISVEKIEKISDIKMTKSESFGKFNNLNKILFPISSQELKNRIAFYYNKENERLKSNGPINKNIPTLSSNSNVSTLPVIKIKK